MQRARRIPVAVLLVVGTLLVVPASAQAKVDGRHNGTDVPSLVWNVGKAAHGCTLDNWFCLPGLSEDLWHYRWFLHHGSGGHS